MHVKCSKKEKCTCQINITDNYLIKKINNYIYINEAINTNYFLQKKIGWVPPNDTGKKFSIIKTLNKNNLKFSNELVYNCNEILNYRLMEYGIFELCEEDVIIYNKVKKMAEKGEYNYIKIYKDNDQGYIVKASK